MESGYDLALRCCAGSETMRCRSRSFYRGFSVSSPMLVSHFQALCSIFGNISFELIEMWQKAQRMRESSPHQDHADAVHRSLRLTVISIRSSASASNGSCQSNLYFECAKTQI